MFVSFSLLIIFPPFFAAISELFLPHGKFLSKKICIKAAFISYELDAENKKAPMQFTPAHIDSSKDYFKSRHFRVATLKPSICNE
jgi:hypothetical protein